MMGARKSKGITAEAISRFASRVKTTAALGSSSVISERSIRPVLVDIIAPEMAKHPNTRNEEYIQDIKELGVPPRTAQRIAAAARKKSYELSGNLLNATRALAAPPAAAAVVASSQSANTLPPNRTPTPFQEAEAISASENLTDYVKLLPKTLPLPIGTVARPDEQSTVKQVNLQNLHNELFLPGTDRFIKQLRYQAPVTSNNPFGLYQLAAPHREKIRYGAIWDAIGNNDIPPLWFPAILPYLAEEGLLEYYKVEPDLVAELEQARQTYISDGVLQTYDRKSTFIPRTKPPHAPDGYVYT